MSPAAFAAGAPWAPVMVALHVPAAAQLTAVAIPLAAATTWRAARAGRRSNQIPCPDPSDHACFLRQRLSRLCPGDCPGRTQAAARKLGFARCPASVRGLESRP